MIALILNIFLTVAFFHVIRSAQVRGRNMMVVGAVNYLLASPLCFAVSLVQGNLSFSDETLFWGVIQGVAFIGTYYLICASMALSGMAIATAIVRLGVVIPVLASIFFWGETPSAFQVAGIFACLVAMPLIGFRSRSAEDSPDRNLRGFVIVCTLFLGMGIAGVASKGFVEADVADSKTTFMGVLYGVSAIGALLSFLWPGWRTNWTGTKDGLKLGIVNVASILSYLVALEEISGVIAFPVQAVGGIVMNTLFAAMVWHERFVRRTLIGMGVAVVGLMLVNVR